MESESAENVGFFWLLRKPLLVRFCFVVWVLFSVFPIFCITSFGDMHSSATPRYNQNILLSYPKRMRITRLFFVTDLEKESVKQRIKEIIW